MSNQDNEITVKTPEYVSIEFQPAGLGSRAVSFMIDQFIITALNMILLFILFFLVTMYEEFFLQISNPLLPIAIFVILIFFINTGYFFILKFFTGGRTIGKKVIGIRVIQENDHSITLLS